jgi:hypothetical protein
MCCEEDRAALRSLARRRREAWRGKRNRAQLREEVQDTAAAPSGSSPTKGATNKPEREEPGTTTRATLAYLGGERGQQLRVSMSSWRAESSRRAKTTINGTTTTTFHRGTLRDRKGRVEDMRDTIAPSPRATTGENEQSSHASPKRTFPALSLGMSPWVLEVSRESCIPSPILRQIAGLTGTLLTNPSPGEPIRRTASWTNFLLTMQPRSADAPYLARWSLTETPTRRDTLSAMRRLSTVPLPECL